MRVIFTIVAVLAATSAFGSDENSKQAKKILRRYCLKCHNTKTSEADVDLSNTLVDTSFLQHRKVWLGAADMVESGAMPPDDHERPSDIDRNKLSSWIRSSLATADWSSVRAPGRVALRRVTAEEFEFAAEDLLGVQVNLKNILPSDPEGLSGFTNDHTSLVMTEKHLMRFIKAAEVIAETYVDQAHPKNFLIHYEVEEGTNASFKKPVAKDSDGSKGWSFSSRLGNKYQAVSKTFLFERTGFYRIRFRAKSKGPGDNAAAWIAVDSVNDASRKPGVLVKGKKFGIYETELFITKGRHTIIFGYDFYGPLWLPKATDRAQIKLGQSTFDPPPYDRTGLIPKGLTIADLQSQGFSFDEKNLDRANQLIRIINGGYYVAVLDNLMLHKFHYEKGYLPVFLAGLGYDYQEKVVPAFRELAKITQSNASKLEKIWASRQPDAYDDLKRIAKLQQEAWTSQDKDRKSQVGDLFVDWIEMQTTSDHRSIPQESEQVKLFLRQILPRALRRPINAEDLDQLLAIYAGQLAEGTVHRDAFQRMLMTVLISPEFLYRSDGSNSPAGIYPLSPYPFVSRLSSFLWSSLPDQQLLRKAQTNELISDAEINQQVDRMLDDGRRERMAKTFIEQWLNLSDIGLTKEPDKELFRYFSWRLAEDMREEVTLSFDRILYENRSILELLDSNETFLNERLARLYGIEGIDGERFRLTKIEDPKRGGLLGTAAVLTSTSLATRTSPVRRGQFILETLLDVELPSPPPDVPQLSDEAGQTRDLSLRESLARHRSDVNCSGCHNKIDPLGFALENYDWIGRWRENDPAGKVDSRAKLPDGRKLNGIADLKKFLVAERGDQFTAALTRFMLEFAVGRELDYFDEDAVLKIVREVKNDGYKGRTLIKAVARSYPFRFREIKE